MNKMEHDWHYPYSAQERCRKCGLWKTPHSSVQECESRDRSNDNQADELPGGIKLEEGNGV